jgi:hypothetical protein
MLTPDQQRGLTFERSAAEKLGLSLTPGSGNGAERSDAKGRIRLSCKSTQKRSWAETKRQLAEAIDLAQGTDEVPMLAVEEPETGEQFLVVRLSDAAKILTDDARPERKVGRAEVVRSRMELPSLLRD